MIAERKSIREKSLRVMKPCRVIIKLNVNAKWLNLKCTYDLCCCTVAVAGRLLHKLYQKPASWIQLEFALLTLKVSTSFADYLMEKNEPSQQVAWSFQFWVLVFRCILIHTRGSFLGHSRASNYLGLPSCGSRFHRRREATINYGRGGKHGHAIKYLNRCLQLFLTLAL